MPRPNQPRTLGTEKTLARRIRWEREAKGMTYEALAAHMADAGCPIQPSALYKIEKGHPPRRITVDELVALQQVFGGPRPLNDLLLPPEIVGNRELRRRLETWRSARLDADEAFNALAEFVIAHDMHPEVEAAFEGLFSDDDMARLLARVKSQLDDVIKGGAWRDTGMAELQNAKAEVQRRKRGKGRG